MVDRPEWGVRHHPNLRTRTDSMVRCPWPINPGKPPNPLPTREASLLPLAIMVGFALVLRVFTRPVPTAWRSLGMVS